MDFNKLLEYDRKIFLFPRTEFLRRWIAQVDSVGYYLENKVVIMKPLPERIRAYKNKFHTDRRNILDPTLASSRNWFENMKEIKNVKPRVSYSREVKTKNPIYNMLDIGIP